MLRSASHQHHPRLRPGDPVGGGREHHIVRLAVLAGEAVLPDDVHASRRIGDLTDGKEIVRISLTTACPTGATKCSAEKVRPPLVERTAAMWSMSGREVPEQRAVEHDERAVRQRDRLRAVADQATGVGREAHGRGPCPAAVRRVGGHDQVVPHVEVRHVAVTAEPAGDQLSQAIQGLSNASWPRPTTAGPVQFKPLRSGSRAGVRHPRRRLPRRPAARCPPSRRGTRSATSCAPRRRPPQSP